MAKLDMIGLTCRDIAASLAFYKLLGVNTPTEWEGPYCETTLEGGIRLSWNDERMIREVEGEHFVEPKGQRTGLAFLFESPAGVDAKYDELVAAGYVGVMPPWDAFWGQRYARISDPDSAVVDLFAWL